MAEGFKIWPCLLAKGIKLSCLFWNAALRFLFWSSNFFRVLDRNVSKMQYIFGIFILVLNKPLIGHDCMHFWHSQTACYN